MSHLQNPVLKDIGISGISLEDISEIGISVSLERTMA